MPLTANILSLYKGSRCLVTGGTGMIGRQVVALLERAGAQVRIASLDSLRISTTAEHIHADLTHPTACESAVAGMNFVFHIAGVGAPVSTAKTHIASHMVPTLLMNTNMLEACRKANIEKMVFTSSVGAYAPSDLFIESEYTIASNPMDFAGWAKRMAELQIFAYKEQYGLSGYAIVRPSNVYGPGDNFNSVNGLVIPSLMSRIKNGENPLMVWGDGSAIRDFIFSCDAAEGIIRAHYFGTNGSFVNLGSGHPVSIRELVETLAKVADFKYQFDATKPTGVKRRCMDMSHAKNSIGFEAVTSLADGLKLTWDWYCANPNEHAQKANYFATEKS